jgi:hypothetical protein
VHENGVGNHSPQPGERCPLVVENQTSFQNNDELITVESARMAIWVSRDRILADESGLFRQTMALSATHGRRPLF